MTFFDRPKTSQGLETFFACTASRASPILRCLIKGGTLGYFAFSIAAIRIINTTTIDRLTLIHLFWFGHCKLPGAIHKWPIFPISVLREKINSRNINHMPAVKFFARLDLDQICLFLDRHSLWFDGSDYEVLHLPLTVVRN